MNTYATIIAHIEKYKYLRGQYKGQAPADPSKRSRNNYRAHITPAGNAALRFHNTDIVTAKPDGTIMLNTNGYHEHMTTRAAVNDAIHRLVPSTCPIYYMGSRKVMGVSQTVIISQRKTYVYYDGITFNGEGQITTPLQAFKMRRINKAESIELAQELELSGFRKVFPLMYAAVSPSDVDTGSMLYRSVSVSHDLRDVITDAEQADKWSLLIANFKYATRWDHETGGRIHIEIGDVKSCWTMLMGMIKNDMYGILASDVFVLGE